MVKINLQVKAELDHVEKLEPASASEFEWRMQISCSFCKETTGKLVYFNQSTEHDIPGSRGTAHFLSKCKLCGRDGSIEIIRGSIKPYTRESNGDFATILAMECRGVEPVVFEPGDGWKVSVEESSTVFSDVEIKENEWVEYDESTQSSVGIYSFASRFTK